MSDINTFLNSVKRAAVEAVEAGKPFAFALGEVTSAEPLKVRIDQKMELVSSQLILTNAVRDYTVSMTVDHETSTAGEEAHAHSYSGRTEGSGGDSHMHGYSGTTSAVSLSHTHAYKGTKSFKVHLALKKGEKVLLLRTDGGRKYIILDRVEVPV